MEEDLPDKTPKLKKSRPEFEEHNEEFSAQNASCVRYKPFPNKDKGESSQDLQVRSGIFPTKTLTGNSQRFQHHLPLALPQVSWSITSPIAIISERSA